MTNNLKRAVDTDLSGLRVTGMARAAILENALEGKKVKRKISVAFVLVMALVLAAAGALALVTIRETGRTIAQVEKENGDYLNWPVEKRAQIVSELMDEGYIAETAERKQLHDGALTGDAAAQVADAAIAEFTGEDAQYAGFLGIMNAAWGSFEDWTHEQQAWYSRLMTDVGNVTEGKTYYVEPTGPLTEEDAIAVAKQETLRVFDMAESLLDQYRVECSFQIPEDAEAGDKKAYWYVCFDRSDINMKGQELPFEFVDMFVDPDTGKLRTPLEELAEALKRAKEVQELPVRQAIRAFGESGGETKNFMTWSIENKARWSSEIVPLMKAYLQEHPDEADSIFARDELASIHCVYGLPDDHAITLETALDISREALRSRYQLSEEELALLIDNEEPFYKNVYYDVTDPSRPMWKIFFTMPSIYGSNDALATRVKAVYGNSKGYDRFFKVEMDAYTGEVIRTLHMPYMPDTQEGYNDLM